jgi:thiol-disulfide isomerase/thioredoxin
MHNTVPTRYRFVGAALFVAAVWVTVFPLPAHSGEGRQEEPIIIYFFWGDGCPHCAEEKPFLEQLAAGNPQVTLESHEVYYDAEGRARLEEMAEDVGFEVVGVPVTIIGDRHWIGYNGEIGAEMAAYVNDMIEEFPIAPNGNGASEGPGPLNARLVLATVVGCAGLLLLICGRLLPRLGITTGSKLLPPEDKDRDAS